MTTSKKFTREGYAYEYWYIYKLVNGKAYYWCRDKNTGGNAGFYAYDTIPSTHSKVKVAHGTSLVFSVDRGTTLYLTPAWVKGETSEIPSDKPEEDDVFSGKSIVRVAGQNRYGTATVAANAFRQITSANKFSNIIVASGADYADALAGSYLAKVKEAPILLVDDKYHLNMVKNYISKNLEENGTVYLLGGNAAVSSKFENSLKGMNVKRLGGANRYETNVSILKEAGVENEDLLVCTGANFADSLSASAVGKPIVLTSVRGISDSQKTYLKNAKIKDVYLIGGTGAVSNSVANQFKTYDDGKTERISGANRYETSAAIAKKFFSGESKTVVLAYAMKFPDGLSGGPLAMSLDAPLLLVDGKRYNDAARYAKNAGVEKLVVMGGDTLITEKVVDRIIN